MGAAVGRGSHEGIFRTGVAAFVLTIGFMNGAALLFFTANDWLVSLYIRDNPAVSTVAATLVIMGGIFQLSDDIQVVAVGGLAGFVGRKRANAYRPVFVLGRDSADELSAGVHI